MESPVVVDKPPEYHGQDDRGFPFDDDEGSGAWSELAARHPDIAARLRQRDPAAAAAWARKRRSPQANDFSDSFNNFDRFPFNDIPPEFREHFPSHWSRRFGSGEESQPQEQCQQQQQHPQQPQSPLQQTTSTQTEHNLPNCSETPPQHQQIPQYGLRNTVDLGQKSAADPSLVDGEDRSQRSMSAPPDSGPHTMSSPHSQHSDSAQSEHPQHKSNVRTIPIFVEGRDEPVINKNLDSASHFGDAKPTYATPPPHHQPPQDNSYFEHDGPVYHPPRNFTQSFGTPFTKPYRQNQQPFAQKVYPQSAAFARGASPGRAQSPKAQHHEEIKIPVQHEKPTRPEPQRPQPKPQQQQQQRPQPPQQQQPHAHPQQPHAHPQQPHAHPQPQEPRQQTPPPQPPKQQTQPQDPITQILAIQTDVLNLMTEVEKFTGTKKDKEYMFLDEMLTRNLIKLDNIETEGKENIRNARKEAIRCIQKCIAVLEAKADGRTLNAQPQENQPSDTDMTGEEESGVGNGEQKAVENGEAEQKEANVTQIQTEPNAEAPVENPSQGADTRPDGHAIENISKVGKPEDNAEKKPKKGGKATKKRDKSKDNSTKSEEKGDKGVEQKECVEAMQIDDKGDKEPQKMDVDGATSQ